MRLGFSLEDEEGARLTEKGRRGASAKGNSSHEELIYAALISSWGIEEKHFEFKTSR